MADRKFKYTPFMTARGIARYPKLSEPDTKGEYADGKYKTEFVFESKKDEEALIAKLKQIAKENFGTKDAHLPFKDGKEEGEIIFNFKSPKKKPVLQDAKNQPIPDSVKVGGGSTIRVAGVIAPWEKGSKRGLSLWPDAVRVIRLSENGFAGFGAAEDGFDADDRDGGESAFDNESGDDNGDNAPDDADALKL